jgi:hypothetical protein
MDHFLGLACIIRGAEYAVGEVEYVCPKRGDDGILDVIYDYFNKPDQQWLARMSAANAICFESPQSTVLRIGQSGVQSAYEQATSPLRSDTRRLAST